MRKRLHAASCKGHEVQLASTALQHIWVSDQLLEHTFSRFTRSTRRHGSNVPGPLEAHRRASKRKNTSTAYIGGESCAVDPAIIISTGSRKGWWKRPAEEHQNALQLRTGWAWSFLHPDKPSSISIRDQTDFMTPESQRQKLAYILEECRTTDRLRIGISTKHLNLRQEPQLCFDITSHILKSNWAVNEVKDFLLSPDLNPPGSTNHLNILKHYQVNTVKREDRQTIIAVVIESARLGILTLDTLKDVLRLMCGSDNHEVNYPNLRACYDLLQAISESSVYGLRSLGMDFIGQLTGLVERNAFSFDKARILIMLQENQGSNTEDIVRKLSIEFLDSHLSHDERHRVQFSTLLDAIPFETLMPTAIRITEDLASLMSVDTTKSGGTKSAATHQSFSPTYPDAQRRNTAAISPAMMLPKPQNLRKQSKSAEQKNESEITVQAHDEATLVRSQLAHNKRQNNFLEIWFEILRFLSHSRAAKANINLAAVAELFRSRPSKVPDHQKLIIHLWTVMAMTRTHNISGSVSNETILSRLIYDVFEELPDAGTGDVLGKVITTVCELPLPSKDALLNQLKVISRTRPLTHGRTEKLNGELQSLMLRDFEKLEDSKFHRLARRNFPLALQELCQSVNGNLPLFEQVSRRIIRGHKKLVKVILRILLNNKELQFALSKSWSKSVPKHARANLGHLTNVGESLSGQPASAAVRLIHVLAMEFALSDDLSKRNALRKTLWCFEFLNRYGSPIHPVLIRALWHAGVVRQDGHACVTVVAWLLNLVKEYEGDGAARKLLLNSNFSRLGLQQWDLLLDVIHDKKKPEGDLGSPLVPKTRVSGTRYAQDLNIPRNKTNSRCATVERPPHSTNIFNIQDSLPYESVRKNVMRETFHKSPVANENHEGMQNTQTFNEFGNQENHPNTPIDRRLTATDRNARRRPRSDLVQRKPFA